MTRAVIIALSVLALAAVLAGILTRDTRKLVRVCDGGTVARYSPPAVCESHALVWPRAQLPLRVGPANPIVADAVAEVTAQVGRGLLRMGEPADVTVTLGVPHEASWRHAVASTRHTRGARMSAEVLVGNVVDRSELHAVLVHELGHVLGLAHDSWEGSIMHTPLGNHVRFSDADRALLRRTYGVAQ